MPLDSMQLDGKTVVVTGAAGGLGGHFVRALAAAGANVLATDVAASAETGAALVANLGAGGRGAAAFVPADITSDEDWADIIDRASTDFGGIDALVNNAAIYEGLARKRPLTELTTDDWDTVLRVNVRGTWQGIRAVVPAMRAAGGGSIVNISSAAGRTGAPGFAHYVASKAAVEGLTRAAARELGRDHITVNAVAPGLVSDEASLVLNSPDQLREVARSRALAREMMPEDLIGAVAFLLSPAGSFVTGQTLVVDGGGVLL